MEKNTIDGPTAQRLYAGLQNSTDHTPDYITKIVHKRITHKLQIQLIDNENLHR